MYTSIKTYQILHFKYYSLMYVDHTSINLPWKTINKLFNNLYSRDTNPKDKNAGHASVSQLTAN